MRFIASAKKQRKGYKNSRNKSLKKKIKLFCVTSKKNCIFASQLLWIIMMLQKRENKNLGLRKKNCNILSLKKLLTSYQQ